MAIFILLLKYPMIYLRIFESNMSLSEYQYKGYTLYLFIWMLTCSMNGPTFDTAKARHWFTSFSEF